MLPLLMPAIGRLHRALFQRRYERARSTWLPVAPAPAPKTASRILVTGFLDEALGIGEAGRLTHAALSAAGFDVTPQNLRPLMRRLLTRTPQPLPVQPDVWIVHANPPEARMALFAHAATSWRNTFRIGYWAWESTRAPDAWAKLAPYFHQIWVPSRFVRDAVARTLIEVNAEPEVAKLRVVPHPVTALPSGAERPDTPVTALTLFDPRSHFERKNPEGALKAWLLAFAQPVEGARLIVKSHAGAENLPAFRRLKAMTRGRPDIEFVCETLNATQTRTLIARSHILLSLPRAEGFGLPLAEAMADGVCVVASRAGGNVDFMTQDNSLLVEAAPVPANRHHGGPAAQWWEPDLKAAAVMLRQAVLDPTLRTRLGTQARKDIAGLRRHWQGDVIF